MARITYPKPATANEGEFNDYVLERPALHPVAFHGVLADMVDAACANSEAVPPTVAIHILARFAATIGRTAFIQIADQQRHLRMNALIVGPSAKGRKGTSADMPRKLFEMSLALFKTVPARQLSFRTLPLTEPVRELSALATGEGLIYQVRDPAPVADDKDGDNDFRGDPGVHDKRLLCNISEFAGVLAQARREGATISTVLRDAFDGGILTIPTKTSFNEATDSHIVVVGSMPETEIVKCLTSTDITNGLANRFPMFYSVRTKTVPNPKPTDPDLMRDFAQHVASALWEAVSVGQIALSSDAEFYWRELYMRMEEKAHPAEVASLLGRQSLYTLIFAALLALLNRKRVIGIDQLAAAEAWMEFWEQTTLFVFSSSERKERAVKMAALKDEIVEAIATLGGSDVTWSSIASKVTNKYQKDYPTAKDVKEACELLQRESPPRIHSRTITTGGRPSNLYSLGTGENGSKVT